MFLRKVLASAGFDAVSVERFEDAQARLRSAPPTLLITEIRLDAYNGLHLVLYAQSIRPGTAAIVTSYAADSLLRPDTEGLGATYVMKPVHRTDLLAAVFRTLAHRPGAVDPIRPPFERRLRDRRARDGSPLRPDRRQGERRRDAAVLMEQSAQGR